MTMAKTKISGPFTMRIELGKVREFLRATAADSWDLPPDSDAPIPATFLTTTRFWDAADARTLMDVVDLDLKRLLHGSQEYEFPAGPPRVGETLTYSTFLVDSYTKVGGRGGQMRFLVTETEFRRPSGELAAISRGTFIETASPAS
jgi:hypothetical protein